MEWVLVLFSMLKSYVERSASEARRWFRAGNTFWIWLAVTIVILLVSYEVRHGELVDRIRWAGAAFEFLGISAVVISISRARRSFGKPSVFRGIWVWLGAFRFIFFRRPPVAIPAALLMGARPVVDVATLVFHAPKSIEERVDQLETQFTNLQTKVMNVDRKVDQPKQEVRAELDREAAERQAGDWGVSNRLEESMIGDTPLELAGIAYLYLGLAMTHLSPEVAGVLKWFGAT